MRNKNEPKHIVELVKAGCYLPTKQAAIYLSISPRTLEKYRAEGKEPQYLLVQSHPIITRRLPNSLK